jgi:hypothetical protein
MAKIMDRCLFMFFSQVPKLCGPLEFVPNRAILESITAGNLGYIRVG